MFSPALRVSALGFALGLLATTGAPTGAEDKKEEKKIELKVGDAAPAFSARTDADTTWETTGRVGKKWIVCYYPI